MFAALVSMLMLQTAPSSMILPRITRPTACPDALDGDIVVCGRRNATERYRLPPSTRGSAIETQEMGSGASGASVLSGTGPCGIHAGQRRCSHAETASAGYGGGRDPLTFARKILTRLIDPDAAIDPPASPPAGP